MHNMSVKSKQFFKTSSQQTKSSKQQMTLGVVKLTVSGRVFTFYSHLHYRHPLAYINNYTEQSQSQSQRSTEQQRGTNEFSTAILECLVPFVGHIRKPG